MANICFMRYDDERNTYHVFNPYQGKMASEFIPHIGEKVVYTMDGAEYISEVVDVHYDMSGNEGIDIYIANEREYVDYKKGIDLLAIRERSVSK